MDWNPASASVLMVPGKSLAIIWRTGQVWHPMGRPRGLAAVVKGKEAARADVAVMAAVDLRKVRRGIADIRFSFLLCKSPCGTRRHRRVCLSWLELPAGTTVGLDEFFGRRRIRNFQVHAIPGKLLAGLRCSIT